jgi:uncharacterized protein (AIM24 family)
MATKRATGRESNPVDDEFLHHLYRGGELLAAGKVIEAKDYLERAHKLQPKNEKGQNLLGLTYFKLGLFDRAAELYEMLVRDNPVDPTLRVNLGLVYLKTNALQRAVREFEVAVDLAPDHKKAHNYLGLALAQQGEYGRAREHFLQAGSDAMAEKMTRAIAGEGFSRPAPVQPAKERGFAELEGAEVVREQGGEPVPETPVPTSAEPVSAGGEEVPAPQAAPEPPAPAAPPVPEPAQPPSAAEDDWGAQFGLEESAQQPQEAVPEFTAATVPPEAEITEYVATGHTAESQLYGAEGPVMVASNKGAMQAEAAPSSATEPAAPAQEGSVAPPVAEDDLPVLPVEEVSEDGLPLLTAEPEDAEDLAAIAQHEQAPGGGMQAALPPPAPEGALPPSPLPAPREALPPPPPPEALSPQEAQPEFGTETAAELTASQPEGAAPSAPSVDTAPEAPQAEVSAASPVSASAAIAPQAAGPGGVGRVFRQEGRVPVLAELAPALVLVGAGTESPFSVGVGGFSAVVNGELLTRLDGLVAFTGQLSFKPEMKRFRGRTTDKAFGEGPARMVRASGRGVLFIEPVEKRTFHAVDLGEESAYFRDECVFAFEEPVMFENGRVPSDVAPDLDLVHLRGNGKVLLSLAGPLRSVPVGMEGPVTVPLTHLVGWQGNLTPRVVTLLQGAGGEVLKTAVELSGEGFALICLPVR